MNNIYDVPVIWIAIHTQNSESSINEFLLSSSWGPV